MKIFIADAFAAARFAGNRAGIVLLETGEDFPEAAFMQRLAAELKHAETAFVKRLSERAFQNLLLYTGQGSGVVRTCRDCIFHSAAGDRNHHAGHLSAFHAGGGAGNRSV